VPRGTSALLPIDNDLPRDDQAARLRREVRVMPRALRRVLIEALAGACVEELEEEGFSIGHHVQEAAPGKTRPLI
jgi:hypothetical protein